MIFDEQDDREGDGPVAQQADEITDNGRKVVLTGNGKDGNNQRVDEGPDESGHSVEIMSEELQREPGGVVDGDVVT